MKKCFLFLGLFFSLLGGVLLWQFFPRNQCQLPITFFPDSLHPYMTVEIEGKKVLLEMDLGSGFPLSIDREVLAKIQQKKYLGEVEWKDFQKKRYVAKDYLIPKMKLGRAIICDICAHEESEEFLCNTSLRSTGAKRSFKSEGRVGLGLFRETNVEALFLDLNNARAFMIKNIRKFQEKGYSLENMVRVPLLRDAERLFLLVKTDAGEKKFMLDTGYTINVLHPSLNEGKEKIDLTLDMPFVTSSQFTIGNRDFGEEDFYLLDFDYKIEGMGGVLGMPFFKKFALFLDFQNNVAYISLSQTKK